LLAAVVALALPLRAADLRADDVERPAAPSDSSADRLIERGLDLRRAGRDEEALAEFRRAYAKASTPRAQGQMALAEQALGLWEESEADLKATLERADPWVEAHRPALEESLAFVASHLGWLAIETPVSRAEVFVNGIQRGETPLSVPLRVVTGNVHVTLLADGYSPVGRATTVQSGEVTREAITLVPLATGPVLGSGPAEAPRPRNRHAPLFWSGLSLLGSGAGFLVVSGFYGARVLVEKGARDEHCEVGRCDARGLTFDEDARHDATFSTLAASAGALFLSVGALLLLYKPHSEAAGVSILPAASPRGAALRVVGAW
jgi:hypothetical protein